MLAEEAARKNALEEKKKQEAYDSLIPEPEPGSSPPINKTKTFGCVQVYVIKIRRTYENRLSLH